MPLQLNKQAGIGGTTLSEGLSMLCLFLSIVKDKRCAKDNVQDFFLSHYWQEGLGFP